MGERAILFIDGNNWYHALRGIGMSDLGRLNYAKISMKLAGPAREWRGTRYYIGQVNQAEAPARLEVRAVENLAAEELLHYLNALPVRIETRIFKDLLALAHRHRKVSVKVERAVDVLLAVEMVSLARRDEYDVAYLLSADGDLTPAVEEVRGCGKKVFVASASRGAQLAGVANAFIRVDESWFENCWL